LSYLGNTDSAAASYKGRTEKKDDYEWEKDKWKTFATCL
jgi:3-methyladenine DNA glycosylase Mpg